MAKSVRMADIAQKLGISIVSVSKGLSGKEGVSDEMRARILATAREMGYQMPARAEAPPPPGVGALEASASKKPPQVCCCVFILPTSFLCT